MKPIGRPRRPRETVSKLSAAGIFVTILMVFTQEELFTACTLFVAFWLVDRLWNLELNQEKGIHRQHGIPFRQLWATMAIWICLIEERLVEVMRCCFDEERPGENMVCCGDWTYGGEIGEDIAFSPSEFGDTNHRAPPTTQDQSGSSESESENTYRREVAYRKGIIDASSYTLEDLRSHFGRKRKDAAKSLGISISTLKRICRRHGIHRWPNRIRNTGRLLDRNGEKNPSPAYKTQSTNGQTEIENEMVYHFQKPNEVLSDSIAGPNCSNAENGLIGEIVNKPNTCHGNYPDMGFPTSSNYKESEVNGSSEQVLQIKDRSTLSALYQNLNNLDFPQPQIVSTGILREYVRSPGSWEKLLASGGEPILEEIFSGSRNLEPRCSDLATNESVPIIPNTVPRIAQVMPHPTAGQDVMSMTIKVTYRGKIIKFPLPLTSGIVELKKKVSERLELQLGNFDVEYEDEDEEWILINCNEDLRNHLQLFSSTVNQVIRLRAIDRPV